MAAIGVSQYSDAEDDDEDHRVRIPAAVREAQLKGGAGAAQTRPCLKGLLVCFGMVFALAIGMFVGAFVEHRPTHWLTARSGLDLEAAPPVVEAALAGQPARAAEAAAEPEAAETPASYGFVYTAEGMAIADDLVSIVADQGGAKAALEKAEGLLTSSRHFLYACHPLLHRFGRAVFRQTDNGVIDALRTLVPFGESARVQAKALVSKLAFQIAGGLPQDPPIGQRETALLMTCNAAYLHGAIELFLFEAGKMGNLETAIHFVREAICKRLPSKDFRPGWECRHGVGHGIAQFRRWQATIKLIDESLTIAGQSQFREKNDLYNGIWMDHFASTTVSGHDVDDPAMVLGICHDPAAGKGRDAGACLMYSPTAFLLHRPRAYTAALDWCLEGCVQVPRRSSCESSCTSGVGMQTFKENLDNIRLVGGVCDKAKNRNLARSCITGAKGYYSFATGVAVPARMCKQLEQADLRSACR